MAGCWSSSAAVRGRPSPRIAVLARNFFICWKGKLLEGEAVQNGQRLRPGWAGVAAAGMIDADFHSETGCVFLIIYGAEP